MLYLLLPNTLPPHSSELQLIEFFQLLIFYDEEILLTQNQVSISFNTKVVLRIDTEDHKQEFL